MNNYDLLVIGAGTAGSTAASAAAEQGKRVALVEQDLVGGTCLNYGCDPTKTLLHVASLLYQAQHAQAYGLQIQANFDWSAIQRYVQQVITTIRGGSLKEAKDKLQRQGITFLQGAATFLDAHRVQVGEQEVSAERIIIATGSQTVIPKLEGLEETGYITNVEAVSLEKLPQRLAIFGGGAIGVEFAQLFHRFGVEVTIIERGPHMLDKEDQELAKQLCDLLANEGLHMQTGATPLRVSRVKTGKQLIYRDEHEQEQKLEIDKILIVPGRQPALEALHLERCGVETNEKGIVVDETLRTRVPHIWAAGDVNGSLQFTHVASEQGTLVAENAFAERPKAFGYTIIPWVTYTDPPLAHVGLTEEQVRERGDRYTVGRVAFHELERAIIQGQTAGTLKLLLDSEGYILGGHILGVDGDNLLAAIILAMQAHLPARTLATTLLPYPTLSEGVRWTADQALK